MTFTSSGWVAWSLSQFTFPGMMSVNNCFPVQSGFGLMIAGTGSFPSQVGKNMTRVIMSSFVKKTSLFVILRTAVSVSCTIPMTGLFDCGVMIWNKVGALDCEILIPLFKLPTVPEYFINKIANGSQNSWLNFEFSLQTMVRAYFK